MNSAEKNRVSFRFLRRITETQGVPHKIRHLLDFSSLIVVGQHHRVLFFL